VGPIRCIKCGLLNPPNAARCDCGFDFASKELKPLEGRTLVATDHLRFVNFLVDVTAIVVLDLVARIAMQRLGVQPVFGVLGSIVTFLYYFICESTSRRTLGKLVTRTVVVAPGFPYPSLAAIAVRSACRLIPLEVVSGLLPGRRGFWWHDSLSGTCVRPVELEGSNAHGPTDR
jgi:hypothetical protein